ncbi:MAG: hypothetical protein ACPGXY_03105 [Alphaproteobacteria bacterium]
MNPLKLLIPLALLASCATTKLPTMILPAPEVVEVPVYIRTPLEAYITDPVQLPIKLGKFPEGSTLKTFYLQYGICYATLELANEKLSAAKAEQPD